jgi:hypothetical protein
MHAYNKFSSLDKDDQVWSRVVFERILNVKINWINYPLRECIHHNINIAW